MRTSILRFRSFFAPLGWLSLMAASPGCSRSEVPSSFESDGGVVLESLEGGALRDDETSDDSTDDQGSRDDSPADDSPSDDAVADDMVASDDTSADDANVDDSSADDSSADDSSAVDDAVPDDSVASPDCDPALAGSCADANASSVSCVGRVVVACEFVDGCPVERREINPDFCLDEDAEFECADGLDGDGDGAIDCADSDCVGAGPCTVEICDNGFDDDEDGATDCADSQCLLLPACNDECIDENGDGQFDCVECGLEPECLMCPSPEADLGSTLGFAIVSGNTSGAENDVQASCGRGSASPDVLFTWVPPVSGCYDIDTFGSDYDTTLHVRRPCPDLQEIRCDDDSGNDAQSKITLDLPAGEPIAIVVDGYGSESVGEFVLSINACAEDCGDFDDNDLDGLWDCEDPDCEGHTSCVPEDCSNGVDDDDDNLVDCEDEECRISAQCLACSVVVDEELGSATGAVASGSTIGAGRDVGAQCGAGAGSEDVVMSWTAPGDGCYAFDTFGSDYDTVLHALEACPNSEPLACSDDTPDSTESRFALEVESGDTLLVVIDGYGDTSSGEYVLNIDECVEDCTNREDDDLDGRVDCEDDECAMAEPCVPEVCDDGIDNDGDGDTDCEDDECEALEECFACPVADFDLGSELGAGLAEGSTVGAGSNYTASCGSGSRSQDVLFSWVAPFDGCFLVSTDGSNYDTTLHVHGRCPGFEELECDDDSGRLDRSLLEFEAEEGEPYFIVVDGYAGNSSGDYELNIFECP